MNDAVKDQTLREVIDNTPGVGVVYVATVREAEQLYERLKEHYPVGLYHGTMAAYGEAS